MWCSENCSHGIIFLSRLLQKVMGCIYRYFCICPVNGCIEIQWYWKLFKPLLNIYFASIDKHKVNGTECYGGWMWVIYSQTSTYKLSGKLGKNWAMFRLWLPHTLPLREMHCGGCEKWHDCCNLQLVRFLPMTELLVWKNCLMKGIRKLWYFWATKFWCLGQN